MYYRSIIIVLLVMAIMPGKVEAAESYDSCKGTIAALPATISTPGTWCLKQNLSTLAATGNAITVTASDVVIDCNGFMIDGSAVGAGTRTIGIRTATASGTTVRNCNIRGFYIGVYLVGTAGAHLVEDNHLDSNAVAGVWVEGDGSIARRNTILDTGGSSVGAGAFGIYAKYSVDLLENTVSGVFATSGDTYGIRTYSNPSGSIDGNRVRGVLKSGTGAARGIDNGNSGRITVSDNNVTGDGSASSIGLRCAGASGRAKNNVISGFPTAIFLCGNAGGNDTSP